MKCIYHKADLDGICSGAIVKYNHPSCEMIGIDYGDRFPYYSMIFNETVYMCDYSLPTEDMFELNDMCNLIWIDHHKTAMESYKTYCIDKNITYNIAGLRKVNKAACQLTWEYFTKYNKKEYNNMPFLAPDTPLPVIMLGKYDIWDHDDPDVLRFQYGMRIINPSVYDDIWDELFTIFNIYEKKYKTIINNGKLILQYEKAQNKRTMDELSYINTIDGYTALIINSNKTSSMVFESAFDPDKHDIMLAYYKIPNGMWKVSLRSVGNVDVSEIAKKYGGGGHKNAAGFTVAYLSDIHCDKL